MKIKVLSLLRFAVSISLVALLFWMMRDKAGNILNDLRSADKFFYLLSAAIYLLTMVPLSYRFKIILNVQGIRMTLKDTLYLTFIGYFFNNFLPTAIGGDAVKAYYAGKSSKKNAGSFASVFMDRFVGLTSLVIIAMVMLIFKFGELDRRFSYAILIIFCLSAIAAFLILSKSMERWLISCEMFFGRSRIFEKLKKAYGALNDYRNHKALLFKSFVISFGTQLIGMAVFYLLSVAAHANLSIFDVFVFMPIIATVSMLPSINGLGLREGAMVYFFGPLIGADKAFAVSMLWLSVLMITSLIGSIVYALNKHHNIKEMI